MNLKQLYSFSYMKWNELLKKEYKLGPFVRRACSFCKENRRKNIDNSCESCKIDKNLCDRKGNAGLYNEVARARREYLLLIIDMCEKLGKKWEEL